MSTVLVQVCVLYSVYTCTATAHPFSLILTTKYIQLCILLSEFIEKSMCQKEKEFCPWMEEKFQQHWNWTQSMLAQTANTSDYWNMVRSAAKGLAHERNMGQKGFLEEEISHFVDIMKNTRNYQKI